jgi:hypothetical protein
MTTLIVKLVSVVAELGEARAKDIITAFYTKYPDQHNVNVNILRTYLAHMSVGHRSRRSEMMARFFFNQEGKTYSVVKNLDYTVRKLSEINELQWESDMQVLIDDHPEPEMIEVVMLTALIAKFGSESVINATIEVDKVMKGIEE